jgi:hypothetical protein
MLLRTCLIASLLGLAARGVAAEPEFVITIKDHQFDPAELTLPADTKIKLLVKNLDATPEEFESHDLHREKLIAANGEVVIYIGPLKSGIYKFFGDFNQSTAKGQVVVK